MRRTALGLSAFFAIAASATASIAQQLDRTAEAASPDCGYACIFAQSVEPIENTDTAAAVPAPQSLALAQASRAQAAAEMSARDQVSRAEF